MNLFTIIYNGLSEPFTTLHAKRMDFFNEGLLSLVTYLLLTFTDALPNKDAQYLMGWLFVFSLALMLGTNSYFVVKGSIRSLYLNYLRRTAMKRHMKNMAQRLEAIAAEPISERFRLKAIPVKE